MKNNSKFVILVGGLLYNKSGEILLLKRSEHHKTFKGFWQIPEGKMEIDEQPIQTLYRELKEETSLKLTRPKPLFASSTPVSFKKERVYLLRIAYEAEWKGDIILSKEHNDYKWISIQKALKMRKLIKGIKPILKEAKN